MQSFMFIYGLVSVLTCGIGIFNSIMYYSHHLDEGKKNLRKHLRVTFLFTIFWPIMLVLIGITLIIFVLGYSNNCWPWEYDWKSSVRELVKEDKNDN